MNAAKNVNCVSSAVYEDVLSDTSDPQRKLAGSKRTRWDMEEWGKGAGHARPSTSDSPFADITVGGNTGSYTSPSDIETPRSPQTPILSKTVEGSSHSSAETKNVSSTELSVSEEYPCMLPLNVSFFRFIAFGPQLLLFRFVMRCCRVNAPANLYIIPTFAIMAGN